MQPEIYTGTVDANLNGDLARRVSVDTNDMPWSPSPSGTVWRKRVHLVGPAESGQVTSVVRYEPGATFPIHDHPDGEEIFVLDGVFSDEHGDWPGGTYLLNPEGFRHAPFSRDGCVLFVKLRQFKGSEREHVALDTNDMPWEAASVPGVQQKRLYTQDGFTDSMRLESWSAGAEIGPRDYPGGAEIYVIEGDFADTDGSYTAGTWLRFPVGSAHTPHTQSGCTLYIKTGGIADLDPG